MKKGLVGIACLLALAADVAVAQKLYKWVDENGKVQYSDKVPPEAVNRASTEMSSRGTTLKRTEAALTSEQRRQIELDKQRQAEEDKKKEEQRRRDHALLASYTSEREIENVRARNLAGPDLAIKGSQAQIAELVADRQRVEKEIAAFGKKPVPQKLQQEQADLTQQIGTHEQVIRQKTKERSDIIARFDFELRRWRELKGMAAANGALESGQAAASSSTTATTAAATANQPKNR